MNNLLISSYMDIKRDMLATDEWLTRSQVCDILHISRNVFYSLVKENILQAIDIRKGTKKRKVYRVSRTSVEKYLLETIDNTAKTAIPVDPSEVPDFDTEKPLDDSDKIA